MATFQLSLITPESVTFEGDIEHVSVPAAEGYMGVLPGHAPTITSLQKGAVTLRNGSETTIYAIGAGVLEISETRALILADNIELAESLDDAKEKALKLADALKAS